ncbi:hypothetical protein J6590_059711 [Homalodisca vitripennis]|nr:hypothetical protein J6590_059711 [Homalodisca vitripennis]
MPPAISNRMRILRQQTSLAGSTGRYRKQRLLSGQRYIGAADGLAPKLRQQKSKSYEIRPSPRPGIGSSWPHADTRAHAHKRRHVLLVSNAVPDLTSPLHTPQHTLVYSRQR